MTKQQFLQDGKDDAFVRIYSEDHRKWGAELKYQDIDDIECWVEYGVAGGRPVPVALVEEHHHSTRCFRETQLRLYREFAEALSEHYGARVLPLEVSWEANPLRPVGERIEWCDVADLRTQKTHRFTREEWITYLKQLRRRQ